MEIFPVGLAIGSAVDAGASELKPSAKVRKLQGGPSAGLRAFP